MDSDNDFADPDFVESSECESKFSENSEDSYGADIGITTYEDPDLDIFSNVNTSNQGMKTSTETAKYHMVNHPVSHDNCVVWSSLATDPMEVSFTYQSKLIILHDGKRFF